MKNLASLILVALVSLTTIVSVNAQTTHTFEIPTTNVQTITVNVGDSIVIVNKGGSSSFKTITNLTITPPPATPINTNDTISKFLLDDTLINNIKVNKYNGSNVLNLTITYNTTITSVKNELSTLSELKVFPNPTTSFVNINGNDLTSIQVFNMNGELVKVVNNPTFNNTIEMLDLQNAWYIVRTTHENGSVQTSKLLKQ
jgi:hypothetical protein